MGLDPEESDIPRLKELGYEVFTSADSLRGYVRRRNQEAAGTVEEPAGPASAVGSESAPADPVPGPAVRAEFERAMKNVHVRAKTEANYNAGFFVAKRGIMTSMRAEEDERFYEEDEDLDEVFATFDAAVKDRTAPPDGEHPVARWPKQVRHQIAVALRRIANLIESPHMRVR